MTKEEKNRNHARRQKELMKPAYDALMSCYPFTLEDLPGEQWKPITDKYHVSTFGRVKSFKWTKPRILKPNLGNGYLTVKLYFNEENKTIGVHVLVARAFIPNPDNKPQVNHDDRHPMNCYVGNLIWATNAENVQHAIRTGLQVNPQGEDHPRAKLTKDDVIYIRDNPDKLTSEELAEKFGVKTTTINLIQRGETWQNVGGNIREKKQRPVNRTPDETRAQILVDWQTGNYTYAALGRKYGLNETTVSRIIRTAQ